MTIVITGLIFLAVGYVAIFTANEAERKLGRELTALDVLIAIVAGPAIILVVLLILPEPDKADRK